MKKVVQSVKGQGIFIRNKWRSASGYTTPCGRWRSHLDIRSMKRPFLETLDLYAAKSGEELVKEQSYVFTDRGGI